MQCPMKFFPKNAGKVHQHLLSLPAWCIQWSSREISSVQQRQSAWKEKARVKAAIQVQYNAWEITINSVRTNWSLLLLLEIAYSNTVFLNPRQDRILNKMSFPLHFCSIESYQINFIPEKLNLIIVAIGHTSSITLISLSTTLSASSRPSTPWNNKR